MATVDSVTKEVVQGTSIPDNNNDGAKISQPTNAFAELMSKKDQSSPTQRTKKSSSKKDFPGRDGLGAYTVEPSAFGPERIVTYNDDFVVINDLYPKANVHLLVLPRDPIKNLQNPFDAFEDADFLAKTKAEVARAKQIVASELRRRFGRTSEQDRVRFEAMEMDEPPDELPAGRDWLSEVKSGMHAHPSMNHLHVHVFSPDMVSGCMKHRAHYESFNTDFLVPLEAFPVPKDDPRRHPRENGIIDVDLLCWRCNKNFSNKFTRFKEHLAEEFEEWKRI